MRYSGVQYCMPEARSALSAKNMSDLFVDERRFSKSRSFQLSDVRTARIRSGLLRRPLLYPVLYAKLMSDLAKRSMYRNHGHILAGRVGAKMKRTSEVG